MILDVSIVLSRHTIITIIKPKNTYHFASPNLLYIRRHPLKNHIKIRTPLSIRSASAQRRSTPLYTALIPISEIRRRLLLIYGSREGLAFIHFYI